MNNVYGLYFGIEFESAYAKQYKSYIYPECSKGAYNQKSFLYTSYLKSDGCAKTPRNFFE